MKKALLYKPQNDDIDVNVVVYANEACLNWWRCKNSCNKPDINCKPQEPRRHDLLCFDARCR